MLNVELHDKGTVQSSVTDARGFLRLRAKFSKVGIQRYTARELGLQGRPPGDILRILRPAEEVFAQDSLDSFENVPVTNDHPPENVTAANSKKYSVGITLGKRVADGDHTVGELLLQDAQTIADYQAGKVELSDGYGCEIKLEAGVWNGQPYDGIKQNIRGNHTALVGAGRCGGACRIMDGDICEACASQESGPCNCHEGENEMTTTPVASPQLVQRVVDGVSIENTVQGAQVIDKLQAQLADAAKETARVQGLLDAEVAAHKTSKETLEGEVNGLKTQVTDEALDARVTERHALMDTIKGLMPANYNSAGKTTLQLMTDAVSEAYGAEAVKDRSEDYIKGQFASLKPKGGNSQDTVRSSVRDSYDRGTQPSRRSTQVQVRDDDGGRQRPQGRDAYLQRLSGGRNFVDNQRNGN